MAPLCRECNLNIFMRSISRLADVACCAASFIAPLVFAEDRPIATTSRSSHLSLAAFASRREATIEWSKMVDFFVGKEALAMVTAIVLHDPTATPSRMRGLRIDLAHTIPYGTCDWKYEAWNRMCNRANAAIYIESGRIEVVRGALEHGAAKLPGCEQISQYGGRGTGGLIICGYEFASRSASELAGLLKRGETELKTAPR